MKKIMFVLVSVLLLALLQASPVKAQPIHVNVAQNPDGSWSATADYFEFGYDTITGTGAWGSTGFSTNGFSHGWIHDCEISEWWMGVYMQGSDYVTVEYNIIHGTPWAAVMLWGDGTTYNTVYQNEIYDLERDGVVIWGAEWNLYWDEETGYYRALPPFDARGNTIAQNEIDGAPNWNIAIGFVAGTAEDPINVHHNTITSGNQGIMATGMSEYVHVHHNTITVGGSTYDYPQGILIWGEYNLVFHNAIEVTQGTWGGAGINVKEEWWLFYDPSTYNFIHHNTCNNLGIETFWDQNDAGDNRWLKDWAPGLGWEDPHYG